MMPNAAGDTSPSWQLKGPYRSAVVEIAILAVAVPEALMLVLPHRAEGLVPLLILIPILFAVRYGFVIGMGAALLVTLVCFQFAYYPPHVLSAFPKLQAAVFLVAAGIAGQFHDHWKRKLQDMRALAAQDAHRLSQLSARLHVLQASHAELERRLGAAQTSLRASLQRFREQLAKSSSNPDQPLSCIGTCLLQVLAESCNVHACAVYGVKDRALVVSAPLASFGDGARLLPTNLLLREALDSGRVVSVRAGDEGVEQVIAVVPLVDSLGNIHGVVSVTHMPFIAIHQHTFDLMAIIGRQVGEILSSHASLFANAGNRHVLLGRLKHGMDMARFQRMSLAIVTLKIVEPGDSKQLLADCLEVCRGVDQPWFCRDRHAHPVIVMLMPMPDEHTVRAQVGRLRTHVSERNGRRAAYDGILVSTVVLHHDHDVQDAFTMILSGCDFNVPQGRLPFLDALKESLS